jgi:hypothetical protein
MELTDMKIKWAKTAGPSQTRENFVNCFTHQSHHFLPTKAGQNTGT